MEEQTEAAADLYLELLKKCLTRIVFEEPYQPLALSSRTIKSKAVRAFQAAVGRRGLELVWKAPPPSGRAEGRDWPVYAETMIGLKRLDNLQFCVSDVIKRGTPGDMIETGVWRGGASIFMRAVLRAYGDTTRKVWVADSFQGLPKPSGKYDADTDSRVPWSAGDLAVSASEVRENFARYGLLDDQVQFIEGFFQDTLAHAPIEQLAVARLDGDLYESTIVALEALYPRLSVGGYVIIDDYSLEICRQAVDDYRRDNQITEPLIEIDWTGVYWQKLA